MPTRSDMGVVRRIVRGVFIGCLTISAIGLFYFYNPWWPKSETAVSPYGMVGDILPPDGYTRVTAEADDFASYLRSLPLSHPDSVMRQWDGSLADEKIRTYCYRCIDMPLLSEFEQCADVCIRLRAEYLYGQRRYFDIHFDDTQFHTMRYWFGSYRKKFSYYLKTAYNYANTETLMREMPCRQLSSIQAGDVFVYDFKSRKDSRYGHAIMVVDVAVDERTGQKVIMLAQGSTPACSIHILHNVRDSQLSPWFRLPSDADTLDFGYAKYHRNELRHFDLSHVYADSVYADTLRRVTTVR